MLKDEHKNKNKLNCKCGGFFSALNEMSTYFCIRGVSKIKKKTLSVSNRCIFLNAYIYTINEQKTNVSQMQHRMSIAI